MGRHPATHGYDIVGFGWQRTETGWKRYMYRRCRECGAMDTSEMIHVKANKDTCFYCLSQDVVQVQDNGVRKVHCLQCKALSWVADP